MTTATAFPSIPPSPHGDGEPLSPSSASPPPPSYVLSRTISTVPQLWREWTVGLRNGPSVYLRVFLARRTRAVRLPISGPKDVLKLLIVGDSAVRLLITLGARSAWWKAAEKTAQRPRCYSKPKQQLCIQNGTRAHYLNYLQPIASLKNPVGKRVQSRVPIGQSPSTNEGG